MILLSIILSFFIVAVSCKNKILIVSDFATPATNFIKTIRSLNVDKKIEEINGEKVPNAIVNGDDEPVYSSIYYLKSGKTGFEWKVDQVATYLKNGGNFFTVSGNEKLLNEFGIDLIEGKFVESSTAQWNSQHSFSTGGISKFTLNPSSDSFAFKLRNDPKNGNFNPLIQSAMSLSPGSAICSKGKCQSNSQNVSLFATLESRKGSRFAAISSLNLLNQFPENVLEMIVGWLQGTKFTLKISSISHNLSGDDRLHRGKTELDSTIYRVKDEIDVKMCLVDGVTNQRFIPSDPTDFQFELKMMNIQLRKSFDSIDSAGCLNVQKIQLPPKPAIYTLQVNYNRPGWSQLTHAEKFLIRPFRHDEFPRFLRVAVPYYVSWLGLLVASYFVLLPNFFKQLEPTMKQQ